MIVLFLALPLLCKSVGKRQMFLYIGIRIIPLSVFQVLHLSWRGRITNHQSSTKSRQCTYIHLDQIVYESAVRVKSTSQRKLQGKVLYSDLNFHGSNFAISQKICLHACLSIFYHHVDIEICKPWIDGRLFNDMRLYVF